MSFTLIGKKIGMTQVYTSDNALVPVTVVEVGPCPVVQVKTRENDGYEAVQIGFKPQKEYRVGKPVAGHFEKAGIEPHHILREFRTEKLDKAFKVGDVLTAGDFAEGQRVDVIGTTKGHGFQGVVKRFRFGGGPASHGSMFHRRGGSFGQCQWPGEIAKGKKMPGHMGSVRRTTQNLTVVKVLGEKNLLLVKGSIHGANGGTVLVRVAKKQKRSA